MIWRDLWRILRQGETLLDEARDESLAMLDLAAEMFDVVLTATVQEVAQDQPVKSDGRGQRFYTLDFDSGEAPEVCEDLAELAGDFPGLGLGEVDLGQLSEFLNLR